MCRGDCCRFRLHDGYDILRADFPIFPGRAGSPALVASSIRGHPEDEAASARLRHDQQKSGASNVFECSIHRFPTLADDDG